MSKENTFIVLGESGKGKSSLIKILSENPLVKVGNTYNAETQEATAYDCQYKDFKYCLIDTPGYNDSNHNDKQNYMHIKKVLTSNQYSIKGIVLLFSFQDTRFGESHQKGLNKIVNLMPLYNFWDYFTIVFSFYYNDDQDQEELIEQRKEKLKYFKESFEIFFGAFNKTKNIKIPKFSDIKIEFFNIKVKKDKKEKYASLISIFKEKSRLEPFFHKVDINYQTEQFMVLDKNDRNLGHLFEVEFKVYKYMNKKGKIIKTLSKPIKKKEVKQITKKEYDGKFQEGGLKTMKGTYFAGAACYAVGIVSAFFCPPLAIGAIVLGSVSGAVSLSSGLACGIKTATEYLSNKEFNEQKIIEEILLEEDEFD